MAHLPFITVDGKVEKLIHISKCGNIWGNMPFNKPKKHRKQKGKRRKTKRYF